LVSQTASRSRELEPGVDNKATRRNNLIVTKSAVRRDRLTV
jgi:hypothetical protein